MIYEKELACPALTRRSLRRKLSLFREENGAICAHGLHFKQEGEELTCAEGVEETELETLALLQSEGHFRKVYGYRQGELSALDGSAVYAVEEQPLALLSFLSREGKELLFSLTEAGCVRLRTAEEIAEESTEESEAEGPQDEEESPPPAVFAGGSCGAVCHERLFTASGCRIAWSKPLAPEDWTQGEQDAGALELPSGDGDILALAVLKEDLYLFRERGIGLLRARGDTGEFYAASLPVSCGAVVRGSVRPCGDEIALLTESGLFLFDGTRTKRLTGCGHSRIAGTEAVTASCGGIYYAAVREKDGEDCVWAVDTALKRGRFLRFRADGLAGCDELLLLRDGKVYRLTERGLPPFGRGECTLRTEPSLLGLSPREKLLDGVLLEGRGSFRVEARGERGPMRAVSGRAGELLRFPVPVRGRSFSLGIRTVEANAVLKAIDFDLREEAAQW